MNKRLMQYSPREQMKTFIRKYVDVTPEQEEVMADYAISTWLPLPDAVPFLHFTGVAGSGKTRALHVMGAICKHSIHRGGYSNFQSMIAGCQDLSTVTLIMDDLPNLLEFDDGESIQAFLKGRSMKRLGHIIRVNGNQAKTQEVFGNTILASSDVSENMDMSLEARCFYVRMKPTKRTDLPIRAWREEVADDAKRNIHFLRNAYQVEKKDDPLVFIGKQLERIANEKEARYNRDLLTSVGGK